MGAFFKRATFTTGTIRNSRHPTDLDIYGGAVSSVLESSPTTEVSTETSSYYRPVHEGPLISGASGNDDTIDLLSSPYIDMTFMSDKMPNPPGALLYSTATVQEHDCVAEGSMQQKSRQAYGFRYMTIFFA